VRADVRQQPECAVVHARAQVELQLEQPVALRLGDVVRQQWWHAMPLPLAAGSHAEEEEEQQRCERTGETNERGPEVGSEGEDAANRITRAGGVSHWHERAPLAFRWRVGLRILSELMRKVLSDFTANVLTCSCMHLRGANEGRARL
jgi:hypothetical protein